MRSPLDAVPPDLARRLRLARAVLAWERLWPVLVPPLGVAGVLLALALFDVLPRLPGGLHALVLAAAVLAMAGLLGRGLRRIRWPDETAAARRLERDSGLAHRPLAVLADRPAAGGGPASQDLWRLHRERMAALVRRLRLVPPAPNMPAHDPLGLRAAVILLLVVAFAAGGAEWRHRLARALAPAVTLPGGGAVADAWVTPPAYTGLPPVLLRPDAETAVPAGSTVSATLSGGWGGADLQVDGRSLPLGKRPDGSQAIEAPIGAGHRLAVRQAFHTVAAWPIRVVPDAPPEVSFARPPEGDRHGRLHVVLSVSDDYGVATAVVEIRRQGQDEVTRLSLPVSATHPRALQAEAWLDVAAHPWAGQAVLLRPVAEDTAGQFRAGPAIKAVLPERIFTDPVAAAVAARRKALADGFAAIPPAVALLAEVAADPALFHDDPRTFLALRLADLLLEEPAFDLDEVRDLMWNAALRIDDGDLPAARRAFEAARQALENALDRSAPAGEIQPLLDRLEQAAQRLLDAMAGHLKRDAADPSLSADDLVAGEDGLDKAMEEMRALAETGANGALRRMLDALARSLADPRGIPAVARDPLGRPLPGGPGDDGSTRIPSQPELQRARQILDELRRRAGEADRPEMEREYLRRLLRQF